jgi:hypothetical protein
LESQNPVIHLTPFVVNTAIPDSISELADLTHLWLDAAGISSIVHSNPIMIMMDALFVVLLQACLTPLENAPAWRHSAVTAADLCRASA